MGWDLWRKNICQQPNVDPRLCSTGCKAASDGGSHCSCLDQKHSLHISFPPPRESRGNWFPDLIFLTPEALETMLSRVVHVVSLWIGKAEPMEQGSEWNIHTSADSREQAPWRRSEWSRGSVVEGEMSFVPKTLIGRTNSWSVSSPNECFAAGPNP